MCFRTDLKPFSNSTPQLQRRKSSGIRCHLFVFMYVHIIWMDNNIYVWGRLGGRFTIYNIYNAPAFAFHFHTSYSYTIHLILILFNLSLCHSSYPYSIHLILIPYVFFTYLIILHVSFRRYYYFHGVFCKFFCCYWKKSCSSFGHKLLNVLITKWLLRMFPIGHS